MYVLGEGKDTYMCVLGGGGGGDKYLCVCVHAVGACA